jgi:hypothetical protein
MFRSRKAAIAFNNEFGLNQFVASHARSSSTKEQLAMEGGCLIALT